LKKEGEEGSNTKTQKPKNTHDRKLRRIMNLERERERESLKREEKEWSYLLLLLLL
jgi:hypothetical protein